MITTWIWTHFQNSSKVNFVFLLLLKDSFNTLTQTKLWTCDIIYNLVNILFQAWTHTHVDILYIWKNGLWKRLQTSSDVRNVKKKKNWSKKVILLRSWNCSDPDNHLQFFNGERKDIRYLVNRNFYTGIQRWTEIHSSK